MLNYQRVNHQTKRAISYYQRVIACLRTETDDLGAWNWKTTQMFISQPWIPNIFENHVQPHQAVNLDLVVYPSVAPCHSNLTSDLVGKLSLNLCKLDSNKILTVWDLDLTIYTQFFGRSLHTWRMGLQPSCWNGITIHTSETFYCQLLWQQWGGPYLNNYYDSPETSWLWVEWPCYLVVHLPYPWRYFLSPQRLQQLCGHLWRCPAHQPGIAQVCHDQRARGVHHDIHGLFQLM